MLVKAKKDLQWLHFSAVLLRLVLCKYELTVESREITQKTENEKNIYQVVKTRYLNSFGLDVYSRGVPNAYAGWIKHPSRSSFETCFPVANWEKFSGSEQEMEKVLSNIRTTNLKIG